MTEAASRGLLSDLRVLEIGHFVAAPFCTRLLADLGADVIKTEPPTGDPVRQWGKQLNGQSLGGRSTPGDCGHLVSGSREQDGDGRAHPSRTHHGDLHDADPEGWGDDSLHSSGPAG